MSHKVRYYLEKPKTDREAMILLRFAYRRQRIHVSTSEHVSPDHWDKKAQRVLDKWCRRRPDYLEVNRILDDLDQFVRRTYNEYRRDHRISELTPDLLKKMLRHRIHGEETVVRMEEPTVADYYRTFIRDRERTANLSRATVASDRVARDWFIRFDAQRIQRTRFADINLGLFEEYRDYFWTLPEERSDSTVHKMLRKFKQVCIHAAAHGHKLGADIHSVQLKSHLRLSSQAMDTIALYDEELEHLANFDLSDFQLHTECRDLFLAGCCTGLRVNRWPQINAGNLIEVDGRQMLSLFTQKGIRKRVVIPLSEMMRTVGERYDWKLPDRKPQTINRYVKEVCQMAGMTETVRLVRQIRGKSVIQEFKKYELISTHTARRSFATNAHAAGIHLDDIQAMTGHADRKTLLHYIKEDAEQRAARLKALPYYGGKRDVG
jgi:site-specific recombinase XerD